jgi:hypothetical protein
VSALVVVPLLVHLGFITEEVTLCEAVQAPEENPAAGAMLPYLTRQLAKLPESMRLCPDCRVAFWMAYEETLEVAQ